MLIYAGQSNMKRVSLECGGKTPQIFLADLPDLDVAVSYAINGIYGNMGEVCNAGSRLLIDKPIAEEFLARFIERGKVRLSRRRSARSGHQPGAAGDRIAPRSRHELHRPRQIRGREARIRRQLTRLAGRVRQSDAVHGRQQPHDDRPGRNLRAGRRGDQVNGIEEALAIANDSIYGLAASVWTRDLNVAHKTVRDLEAGVIWVNCFDHGDMTQPFGGYKQSGFRAATNAWRACSPIRKRSRLGSTSDNTAAGAALGPRQAMRTGGRSLGPAVCAAGRGRGANRAPAAAASAAVSGRADRAAGRFYGRPLRGRG
jgi:hypothetical protein